jgi:hypothetical protein
MKRYRWYSYDVWGNKKDGYEVNQVFRTSEVVEVPNIAAVNDSSLIKYLKKVGFFKKNLKAILFDIDGDEEVIYFSYKGKPEGELRAE